MSFKAAWSLQNHGAPFSYLMAVNAESVLCVYQPNTADQLCDLKERGQKRDDWHIP